MFKSIFLFCWVGLLCGACSHDSVVETDGKDSGVTGNTLITIYFNLPENITSGTRATSNNTYTRTEGNDNDYQHQGTVTENTVSSVNLILMEATQMETTTLTTKLLQL